MRSKKWNLFGLVIAALIVGTSPGVAPAGSCCEFRTPPGNTPSCASDNFTAKGCQDLATALSVQFVRLVPGTVCVNNKTCQKPPPVTVTPLAPPKAFVGGKVDLGTTVTNVSDKAVTIGSFVITFDPPNPPDPTKPLPQINVPVTPPQDPAARGDGHPSTWVSTRSSRCHAGHLERAFRGVRSHWGQAGRGQHRGAGV